MKTFENYEQAERSLSEEELSRIRSSALQLAQKAREEGHSLGEAFGVDHSLMEVLYGEGYRLYNAGLYQKALYLFRGLYCLNEKEARYSLAWAACQQRLKNFEEAIDGYRIVAELEPLAPVPLLYLYECYMQLGKKEEARNTLLTLIEKTENNSMYEKMLLRVKLMLESHDSLQKT